MHALRELLQCPLTRERDARDRQKLVAAFPALQACASPHYLALRPYLERRPQRFFSREAYKLFWDWLKSRDGRDREGLKAYFTNHVIEFDRALLFLREINSEAWHDGPLQTGDDYELVRAIDKHVHPTYLRLLEAVFTPFLRLIAFFSRVDHNKGTDGLDVWSVVEEIKNGPAAALIRPYEHLVRNGIAHGGITYLQREIRYRDKKGNASTFSANSVVRLLDDMLDVCNGIAASLKAFFAVFRNRNYTTPREILFEELLEESSTPWWRIEGCVEAEIGGNSQLIIFARPTTRHYAKVHWSTLQSGILVEYFAPGYDRYFFSLRSPKAWPGWAAFDGQKLKELREADVADLSEYTGVIEDNLVYYVSTPKLPSFLGRIETLWMIAQLHFPIALQDVRTRLKIPKIDCRIATAHRNAWGAVISASAVVEGTDSGRIISTIRDNRRRIVRAAASQARRQRIAAAYLPIAFAQVNVFRADYRCRRLSSFGLAEDLICTIRLHRLRRIRSPDIAGSTVESIGKWRIAWNRAWLDSSGETPD